MSEAIVEDDSKPWKVVKFDDEDHFLVVNHEGDLRIATCEEEIYADEIAESINKFDELITIANALVDALELCQIRVFMHEGSENEAYQAAMKALAQAKVEGHP